VVGTQLGAVPELCGSFRGAVSHVSPPRKSGISEPMLSRELQHSSNKYSRNIGVLPGSIVSVSYTMRFRFDLRHPRDEISNGRRDADLDCRANAINGLVIAEVYHKVSLGFGGRGHGGT